MKRGDFHEEDEPVAKVAAAYDDGMPATSRRPWWLGRYWATALLDMTYTLLHRVPGVRRCPWCREV